MVKVKREFEEGGRAEVLEGVCDRASEGVGYGGGKDWNNAGGGGGGRVMDRCAELAADLIDDYYAEEEEEEDDGMI